MIHSVFAKKCESGDFKCSDHNGLEMLKPSENCTEQYRVCDGHVDCPFGDDEHNCPQIYPNGWICPSDGTYIPLEWSCVDGEDTKVWDCPNQDDVNEEYCKQKQCSNDDDDDSDDSMDNNYFSCRDNGRCIPKRWTCDGDFDCMDGSDESILLCGVPIPMKDVITPTRATQFGPTASDLPTRYPTETPSIIPSISPTVRPTLNPTRTPTLRPTMRPTAGPTIRPTSQPTNVPTNVPTNIPTFITDTPTNSPTMAPSPYFPSRVFLRIFVSEIIDIIDDEATESAVIDSLSSVLSIDGDMIMMTNIVNLNDIINNKENIYRSVMPRTKYKGKWKKHKRKWKKYKRKKYRKGRRYDDYGSYYDDMMGITDFVSIDIEIELDSMEHFHCLMDNFYAYKWKLYETENYIEERLCNKLNIYNIKAQIEKISITPLSAL